MVFFTPLILMPDIKPKDAKQAHWMQSKMSDEWATWREGERAENLREDSKKDAQTEVYAT